MFNIMGAESTALYYIHAENNDCILLRQDNFYGGICPHCPHGSAASDLARTASCKLRLYTDIMIIIMLCLVNTGHDREHVRCQLI